MATLSANKIAAKGVGASKQYIQSTFSRAGYQIDACHMWISSQSNVAQGNISWQLLQVATTQREERLEVLS